MKRIISLLFLVIMLSGCATMGPMLPMEVSISSEPSGATVYKYVPSCSSGDSCWKKLGVTPYDAEMLFNRKNEYNFKIMKEAYKPSFERTSLDKTKINVILKKASYRERVIERKEYSENYIFPKQRNIEKERLYNYKYDEVWESVVHSFASKNIPIKTLEKVSGIIVAEKMIDLSSEIEILVDVGYIEKKTNTHREIYLCSLWSASFSDEEVRTKCKLKEKGNIPTEKRARIEEDIMTVYNVFAIKAKSGVSVTVNTSFRILNSDSKRRYRAVSTGFLEKAMLDDIGEFLKR